MDKKKNMRLTRKSKYAMSHLSKFLHFCVKLETKNTRLIVIIKLLLVVVEEEEEEEEEE